MPLRKWLPDQLISLVQGRIWNLDRAWKLLNSKLVAVTNVKN